MLTQKLRPKNFDELLGNEINKRILKAIIRNPDTAPRVLIHGGSFGSGKTTSARIIARLLNNISEDTDINMTPFYTELDASVVGNKESLKQYQDVFSSTIKGAYKVVVIDEVHAASKAAQTLMLKILEEAKPGIFFILCTTDVDKIIPTIRSRALELTFACQPLEDIAIYVSKKSADLGYSMDEEVANLIAYNSSGHMRNAIMELHKYTLLGKDGYFDSSMNTISIFCDIFKSSFEGVDYAKSINSLGAFPIIQIKKDLSSFMNLVMKAIVLEDVRMDSNIIELVKTLGKDNARKIVSMYFADWARNIYDNEMDLYTGMLVLAGAVQQPKKDPSKDIQRRETVRTSVKL